MNTLSPAEHMMFGVTLLLAYVAFAVMLVRLLASGRLSVRMRTALQWGLLALACGLLVVGVRAATPYVAGLDTGWSQYLLPTASVIALNGALLTPPQKAEGQTMLGARVGFGLSVVALILTILFSVLRALNTTKISTGW